MSGNGSGANSIRSTAWARFAVAVFAVLCAAAVRLALDPLLGAHAQLVLFALSVMVAARFGGVGPGLLATALGGAIAVYYFMAPPEGRLFDAGTVASAALFAAVGIGISVFNGQLRRALALSASEAERRRIVTENAPQLLWTCAADGSCDFLNGRWVEYTGIAAAEQLGLRWTEQIHPDDRARVLEAWGAAIAAGEEFRIEFRIRRRDGAYRWFDTRATAVRDAEDRVVKWFGSNTDIHEARTAREEARAQQERLTRIAATAPGVICSFRLRPDGSSCFPYASPRIRDIYGLEPSDLVDDSAPAFERMHPDDAGSVRESVARSAETMRPWRAEFRVRHPERGEIWVEGHAQPALQADGSIEWHGFITDITERRRMEERVREHTATLEELTRTLDLAHVIVRSLDGRITYWSQGAAALYGWTREEAAGRVSHDLLRTEFPLPVDRIQAELTRTGRWEGELRHYRRDGSAVEVASHWALHHNGGAPRSVIEVNNDISEQKRVERELRASEARLALAQAAAGIVTWDWNLETNETLCSENYGDLYGIPRTTHAPPSAEWLKLIHPDDRAQAQRALRLALDGGRPYEAEFRVVMPDGSVRWLLGKGQAHRDASGKVVRLIGVNLDITERMALSEQLRALSASLISAQEEERRRISRELHDDLVQRLGLMAIDLGKIITRFRALGPRLEAELRAVQQRAAEAAELTRHFAHELHPWILDDLGIATALASLCSEVGRREEIDVRFESGELPQGFSREVASCLYAVAKEALQNVARHARANRVEVRLGASGGVIRLEIHDDGVGFPEGAAAGGVGLGIASMRERIRYAKGTFTIDSQSGRGVRIAVEIPAREELG